MTLKYWQTALLIVVAGMAALGWLVWKCERDPTINFLPEDARAEWIIFSGALDSRTHAVAAVDATFRQQFELSAVPKSAMLQLRAAKRTEIRINDALVEIGEGASWKEFFTTDVARLLRTGQNKIEARVFNDNGPPALWLTIVGQSGPILRTDEAWSASLAGSTWRNAALASVPRAVRPGNFMAGRETTFRALPKIWPIWALFALLSISFTAIAWRFRRRFNHGWLVGVAAICWLALFWNNLRTLPSHTGFDVREHIEYIKYVQEKHSLPLANQGFEMFQPPLYYILSAGALSLFGLHVDDYGAVVVLRLLTMIFGIINFVLVFLSLRLLFRDDSGAHLVGLLIAAFLPMQLYLSHYATNETLAAVLVTAAVYFALRALKQDTLSVSNYAWCGLFAGAAMLAKATGILLWPALMLAFVLHFTKRRFPFSGWLRNVGTTFGLCLAISGWHYIRVWRHFGNPLLGNWDAKVGFQWWQDPGFHTAADYLRFGHSLSDPLFSGFKTFADGIYSTLWGDGLGGGLSDLLSRTPWNYDLMCAGYLVALIPTAIVLLGLMLAIFHLVRSSPPEWHLLVVFSGLVMFGIVFMTLRVPSYAQVKSFYGLSALVPFCCFASLGWKKLTRGKQMPSLLIAILLVFWAISSFASFWIPSSATQRIYAARKLFSQSKNDAGTTEAKKAVQISPNLAAPRCFLANVLNAAGELDQAIEQSQAGLQLNPSGGDCHVQLAISLGKRADFGGAWEESRKAIELEPENVLAYNVAFTCARQLGRVQDAVAIGRDALVVSPFDGDLHYRIGLAAAETGDFLIAIPQFGYALLLKPNQPEVAQKLQLAFSFAAKGANAPEEMASLAAAAPDLPELRNQLGWILATNPNSAVRNGPEALRQSERACALTNRSDPEFLLTLAAAEAETGNFSEAAAAAENARQLAQLSSDDKISRLAENLIANFQAHQPYREEPR